LKFKQIHDFAIIILYKNFKYRISRNEVVRLILQYALYFCLSLVFLDSKTRDKQQETENKKHIVELA